MNENLGENFRDPKKMNKIFGISRNIFLLIVLVLIWMAIVVIFYGPKIVTYFGVPGEDIAVTGEAHLGAFAPSTCKEGTNCEVEIRVDTAQTNVVAVRAIVKFNNNIFEATSIDASGSFFTYEVENEIDNGNGEIRITRGEPTQSAVNNNNALVAKIIFTVKAGVAAGNTTISFGSTTQAPAGDSDVIKDDGVCPEPGQPCSGATDLLTETHGATIAIETAAYNPDLNNDDLINFADAMLYVDGYQDYVENGNTNNLTADVNGDGSVNFTDAMLYIDLYQAAQS